MAKDGLDDAMREIASIGSNYLTPEERLELASSIAWEAWRSVCITLDPSREMFHWTAVSPGTRAEVRRIVQARMFGISPTTLFDADRATDISENRKCSIYDYRGLAEATKLRDSIFESVTEMMLHKFNEIRKDLLK